MPSLDLEKPLSETEIDNAVNAVAERIVGRRLEAPAMLFLEIHRPLSFVASQGLLAALPLIGPLVGADRVLGASKLLENRANIDRLISRIEEMAAARDARKQSDKEVVEA